MNIIKTRAVIIKTQDFKENDKIIWMFSEELGKISVIAKGAKKSKNKNFSCTLPLTFGEYTIYKGKSMYVLNEGRIIESFQTILGDYEMLIYGSYFCELIDIVCSEEEYEHNDINNESINLFKDFVGTLYLLNSKAIEFDILARTFEMKVLRATGYGIKFHNCAVCNKKIQSSTYLSFQFYGMVCDECEKVYGVQISRGIYNIMRYLYESDIRKIARLTIGENDKEKLKKILTTLISLNYSRTPKSLTMLDAFTNV